MSFRCSKCSFLQLKSVLGYTVHGNDLGTEGSNFPLCTLMSDECHYFDAFTKYQTSGIRDVSPPGLLSYCVMGSGNRSVQILTM